MITERKIKMTKKKNSNDKVMASGNDEAKNIKKDIEVLYELSKGMPKFFTGKYKGYYWYMGHRWFGPSNKIGAKGPRGKLIMAQPNDGDPCGIMPQ